MAAPKNVPLKYQLDKYLGEDLDGPLQIIKNWANYRHLGFDSGYVMRQMGQHVAKDGGKKLGSAVGGAIGCGIGMGGGPIPAFITACLGALLGALFAWGAEKTYKWIKDKKYKTKEQKAFKEAMDFFGYNEAQIRNSKIFNAINLRKQYRSLAKKYHPDKQGGSNSKFI
eukprot:UN01216